MTATASSATVLGVARRVRVAVAATVAAILGLLPHVLHHVGPLAGAALFAGIGGSLLFGAVGLVLSVPFLLKVRRRCGNWRVPAVLLVTFAAMFSLSTFVVGPLITADDEPKATPAISHEAHHP